MRQALVSLLGEYRFADISAAMIADRAGIGYATFFRHYADTEALLLEFADAMIGAVSAAMLPALMVKDDAAAMRIMTEHVADDRIVAHALLVAAGPVMQRAITERAVAQSGALARVSDAALPPALVVRYTVAATIAILAWWLESEPQKPASEIAALLLRLVRQPLSDHTAQEIWKFGKGNEAGRRRQR